MGYDPAELENLPLEATASFAGVANPFVAGRPPIGATVVDVGSGAGMDSMLAATMVWRTGRVIGVDPTEAMLVKARGAAASHPEWSLELRKGSAEDLPVDSGTVDLVISNGVLNLTPDKEPALREIARIMRAGGRLQLGDIVVASELSEDTRSDIDLWTG